MWPRNDVAQSVGEQLGSVKYCSDACRKRAKSQRMTCRHLIIVLGDQLNLDNPALEGFDAKQDQILMVEGMGESTHVWSHKARIALFLSAMRHFAQTSKAQGMTRFT
jgi:hypothetical protein